VVRVPDTDDWDWRLSIAESSGSAAFSTLPGVYRELVLLRGAGLVLRFGDGEVRELRTPYAHHRFSGERALVGEPVDGPTEQLNLMWRRDRVVVDRLVDVSVDEQGLVRNRSGIARSRATDEPLEALELEAAIARNVREYRAQRGHSIADMASLVGISKAMLSKIENAQTSCSLTTLAALAKGLDVPVTSLLKGVDTERQASYVKAGSGTHIVRSGTQVGHDYELLGTLSGEHKRLESLMVTLTEKSETYPLFQHPGTEFIHMLEGEMDYGHGRSTYRLAPGDSLQMDGEAPHGPVNLIQVPIRFISVIAFPDGTA
jgi:transcriptional regulator with XRE-family HTH domain